MRPTDIAGAARTGWLPSAAVSNRFDPREQTVVRHNSALPAKRPVFEQIVTGEKESFLWRCDDYPWERNVWNVHPEYELHLVRNASAWSSSATISAPSNPAISPSSAVACRTIG